MRSIRDFAHLVLVVLAIAWARRTGQERLRLVLRFTVTVLVLILAFSLIEVIHG